LASQVASGAAGAAGAEVAGAEAAGAEGAGAGSLLLPQPTMLTIIARDRAIASNLFIQNPLS